MLIHICCSVDSHFFIQKIQQDYPDKNLKAFFYDPNIHPYSEYCLRLLDVKHSCEILGIELIEGEYDLQNWLQTVKGLENEPEKGDRCTVCFDKRLTRSIQKAKELGCNSFTTTLLMSPKKSQEKLQIIGENLSNQYGIEFIFKDYRKNNGMELQSKEVKKNNLYRQNYCGCLFGLTAQREQQDKFLDEMISPINQQILPESIEQRIELYKQRNLLTQKGIDFHIVSQRFLNYRLLSGKVSIDNQTVPSYFLPYSTSRYSKTKTKIAYTIKKITYLAKNEIKLISLKTFNELANKSYKNMFELIYNPLKFDDEVKLKNRLLNNSFDLSCVIVLEQIPSSQSKITVELNSKTYEDVKEEIINNFYNY